MMESGETITCTSGAPGPRGVATLPGVSHAATVAVARSRAAHRIRARRWDSLNVNGICVALLQQLGQKKNRPFDFPCFACGPGGFATLSRLFPGSAFPFFGGFAFGRLKFFFPGSAPPRPL